MDWENINQVIDVSIVIINYNSKELLSNCLSTLVQFTLDIRYEIIVIDNNSIDKDIDSIIKQYPKINLMFNKVNKGFGVANNQGLSMAKGKYILFLNNDTVFFENTVKNVFEFAESKSESLVVGCKLLNKDRTLQRSVFDFPTVSNIFSSNFFLYIFFPKSKWFNKYHYINRNIGHTEEVDVVTGAFLFCTRSKIEEIGGFDERFFFFNEETDLCWRFKQNGGKVYYYPMTSIIHIKGGTAKINSWFTQKNQHISTIKFFQKYYSGLKYYIVISIHYMGVSLRVPVFFIVGLITLNKYLCIRSYYYLRLLFIFPQNKFDGK